MTILTYPLIFIYVYITSFLIHELMHIKSQGILSEGKITITSTGMLAYCNYIKNAKLFYYGGGILSSIIMFILVFLTMDWWQWCYLTMGFLQLSYGMYEGYTMCDVGYRYYIYVIVIIIMLIIWVVK